MSVTSIYLAVDWQQFLQTGQPSNVEECLDAALENDAPWIRTFPFGRKFDRYYFESRKALIEFDDWFRAVRTQLNLVHAPEPKARLDPDTDLIALAGARLKRLFGVARRAGPVAAAQRRAVQSFYTLFLDFGLVHDDGTLKLKPINRTVESPGEWLIATMSPEDVRSLDGRAAAIDRSELAAWFTTALALKPSSLMENGKMPAAWLDALKTGLEEVVRKREGVVFGMA